jgi:hypothetical protein
MFPPRIVALLGAMLFGSLLLIACGDDSQPEPTPEPTPEQPAMDPAEQAIGRFLETQSKDYVGDCSKADASKDVGKTCSVMRGERGQQRAYAMGNTFSEGNMWAIVENRANQWNVVQTAAITPDTAAIPGVPWPLTINTDLVVVGVAPQCLNVREGPALNQRAIDCLAQGARIQLGSGPAMGDGLQWWQVAGRSGWVVADYLRYPDAAQ